MKILLLKDVYHLGHAGDVKKVADGYGRNYLIPQGYAVIATAGALKQAESIREKAAVVRAQLNTEMSAVSEKINNCWITFASKAGETGKLYGSITSQMVADKISEKAGIEIEKRQIDIQPIRTLGEHKAYVRLTIDIVPSINIMVHREGETPNIPGMEQAEPAAAEAVEAEAAASETAE